MTRRMGQVAPELFSHSMACLLHSCSSFSSLCSFQQLEKSAPGSLHKSLLSENSTRGFSSSEGEPEARVAAGQAGQGHSLTGPHSVFIVCPWKALGLKPVAD